MLELVTKRGNSEVYFQSEADKNVGETGELLIWMIPAPVESWLMMICVLTWQSCGRVILWKKLNQVINPKNGQGGRGSI